MICFAFSNGKREILKENSDEKRVMERILHSWHRAAGEKETQHTAAATRRGPALHSNKREQLWNECTNECIRRVDASIDHGTSL
jgi:hypothetical protein